jgi:HEAT repeat protein
VDNRERLKLKLESDDEEIRLQGLKGLAPRLGHDLSLLPLTLEALGDTSWRIRKEAADILLAFAETGNLTHEVVKLLHAQENAGLRNAAVDILVRLGRQAIPSLVKELSCIDQDVRKFVLDILGEIGDPTSASVMLPALSDEDSNVRAAAAENLGKLRATEAAPALLETMKGADLWFCFTALEALGKIGAPVPLSALLPFREENLLRKPLYECLGRVGGSGTANLLVQGLNDEMSNVREAAALALVEFEKRFAGKTKEALLALSGSPTAQKLLEMLGSRDMRVRKAASEIMGLSGDEQYAVPLLKLLNDPDVCQEAGRALLSLGRPAAQALLTAWDDFEEEQKTYIAYLVGETCFAQGFERLRSGLSSDDSRLRLVCAQGLGKLGDKEAVPPLVDCLEDPVEGVREAAGEALSLLGNGSGDEMARVLRPILENGDPQVRMNAVAVLGRLDDREADKALAMAAKDESPLVRRAAVKAFGRKGEVGNLQVLTMGLTDEDTEVRRISAEALGFSGQRRASAPLELALRDEDIWVRTAAVRALGQLGGEECVELAARSLGDPVGLVTIAALETLAGLDPSKAFPALLEALGHDDEEVVNAALKLLASSGRKDWIPGALDDMLNHRHWEVRNAFACLLADLEGSRYRSRLEGRLRIEPEPLVRQQIEDLLAFIGEQRG